jgi:hypothetical protein
MARRTGRFWQLVSSSSRHIVLAARRSFATRHPGPQSQTEEILIDHYRELGGDVEWQTELVSDSQDSDTIFAQVRRDDGWTR